jgi:hypothetical protein
MGPGDRGIRSEGVRHSRSGVLHLEQDKTKKDKYGRTLAYVWFEIDGTPYHLNHILINNGWGDDVDYSDRKYDDELKDAAAFAERHDLGARGLCGGFGVQIEDGPQAQPPVSSGSGNVGNSDGSGGGNSSGGNDTYVPPTEPEDPESAHHRIAVGAIRTTPAVCRRSATFLIAATSTLPDSDRDGDGYGCESYG